MRPPRQRDKKKTRYPNDKIWGEAIGATVSMASLSESGESIKTTDIFAHIGLGIGIFTTLLSHTAMLHV